MPPVSRLFLPPPALADCVMAGIYRDTRGAGLSGADRLNHFPASPMVAVSRVRCGALFLLDNPDDWQGAANRSPLPRTSVMAPQATPVTSWAEGEVEALTLGIYPDAWRVPAALDHALAAFDAAPAPQTGWQALCDSLVPDWQTQRAQRVQPLAGITDWVKHLLTRAALSEGGQSLRSMERRMKRLSGHTRRTLEFFSQVETLQEVVQHNADAPLAEIAHLAGYADQSHMGRAVRRATVLGERF